MKEIFRFFHKCFFALQMDVLTCCTLDIFTVCFLPQTMEIYWLLELIVIAQSNE